MKHGSHASIYRIAAKQPIGCSKILQQNSVCRSYTVQTSPLNLVNGARAWKRSWIYCRQNILQSRTLSFHFANTRFYLPVFQLMNSSTNSRFTFNLHLSSMQTKCEHVCDSGKFSRVHWILELRSSKSSALGEPFPDGVWVGRSREATSNDARQYPYAHKCSLNTHIHFPFLMWFTKKMYTN